MPDLYKWESELFYSVPYEVKLRRNIKYDDTGQGWGFNVSKKNQMLNKYELPEGSVLDLHIGLGSAISKATAVGTSLSAALLIMEI